MQGFRFRSSLYSDQFKTSLYQSAISLMVLSQLKSCLYENIQSVDVLLIYCRGMLYVSSAVSGWQYISTAIKLPHAGKNHWYPGCVLGNLLKGFGSLRCRCKKGSGRGVRKGKVSACYKSRCFYIPPTNFLTNPITSTVNTWPITIKVGPLLSMAQT